MATVASLAVKLIGDTKGLEKSFGKSVKIATKWGIGLAAAAGVAGGAVVGAMTKYGNFADQMLDLSAITGISTDEMQKWRQIAVDSGVDLDLVATSMQTFNKQLERGNVLSPRLAKGFETMGMSAEEFKSIDPDQQLREIVGTMMELEGADKRAFANQMNMAAVLPMVSELEASGKTLDEVMAGIDVPFGEEELTKMNEFRKSWDDFKQKIFEVLGEALQPLFEWFSANMPMIEEKTQAAFDKMSEVMSKATEKIKAIIEWFKEYKEIIVPVIKTVAAIFVASWAIMAVSSAINAAKIVISFGLTMLSAIKTGVVMAAQAAIFVAKWVWMGAQSLINAAKVVLGWAMTGVAAIANVLIMIAQSAIMVAKWVWMGAQSLFQAGRMAAAWFIALGPIGWVIAAIAGLVILIIKYWDEIVEVTKKLWNKVKELFVGLWSDVKTTFGSAVDWISGKVDDLVSYFTNLPRRIKSATSGMWNGVKDSFRSAINWLIRKWNNFQLRIAIPSNFLTRAAGLAGKGFTVNTPNIPTLAVGTDLVKNDGLAQLHKGEKVVPADVAGGGYTGDGGSGGGGSSGNNIHVENLIVREEADIEKIAQRLLNLQQDKNAALGR